jgi:hypothetical protein
MLRLALGAALVLLPVAASAQVFSSDDEAKSRIGFCNARYDNAEPENMYNCMRPALIHLSRGNAMRTTAVSRMDVCYDTYSRSDKGEVAGDRFLGCLERAAASASAGY